MGGDSGCDAEDDDGDDGEVADADEDDNEYYGLRKTTYSGAGN